MKIFHINITYNVLPLGNMGLPLFWPFWQVNNIASLLQWQTISEFEEFRFPVLLLNVSWAGVIIFDLLKALSEDGKRVGATQPLLDLLFVSLCVNLSFCCLLTSFLSTAELFVPEMEKQVSDWFYQQYTILTSFNHWWRNI